MVLSTQLIVTVRSHCPLFLQSFLAFPTKYTVDQKINSKLFNPRCMMYTPLGRYDAYLRVPLDTEHSTPHQLPRSPSGVHSRPRSPCNVDHLKNQRSIQKVQP